MPERNQASDAQLEQAAEIILALFFESEAPVEFDYPATLASYLDDLSVWEDTDVTTSPKGKAWLRIVTSHPATLYGILTMSIDRTSELEVGNMAISNANRRRAARRKLTEAMRQITQALAQEN